MNISLKQLMTIALCCVATPTYALDAKMCKELSAELKKQLSTMNYCEAEADCVVLGTSCSMGGYALINKESMTAKGEVYNLETGYNVSEAAEFMHGCAANPKDTCINANDLPKVQCIEKKCNVDKSKTNKN